MSDLLELDYETASEVDLKTRGLDVYSAHPSTRILMCAYALNGAQPTLWERGHGPMPAELCEALVDPEVEKWAFNAQFERVITARVAKLKTSYRGWRCTMSLAYTHSFVGDLETVGRQVGLPLEQQKLSEGKRLINLFSKPQRVTKKQPFLWRDELTDPEDWDLFGQYCLQDVTAERGIKSRLLKFGIRPEEWAMYELDQRINDRGLPIDMQFVRNAIRMAERRKAELTEMMQEISGLSNPNSGAQLLPWLRERGYPFNDLQKDTVKKVLTENADSENGDFLPEEAVEILKLRRQAARTSVAKYTALDKKVGPGDRFRFGFQYGGASRTLRWAGRGLNPQNLTRTPKELEADKKLVAAGVDEDYLMTLATDAIRAGDYDLLAMTVTEPMDALAGLVRSSVRADDDEELRVCDLSAIETCVIAWIAGCQRMLEVVASGKDPYKDFGTELYSKPYEEITKTERTNSKPAVLGAGYRLGGGDLKDGKRTGLWGYAENMGINLTKEESHRAVRLFRDTYPEYPKLWYALEEAVRRAMRTGRKETPTIRLEGRPTFNVPVTIQLVKPYIEITLPSGRPLRYHKPMVREKEITWPNGDTSVKQVFSYMGQPQGTRKWVRIESHGGKLTENIVQAIARDVLRDGLLAAHKAGFKVVGHVHDEIIALQRRGDNRFTVDLLREIMSTALPWAPGLPLGAAGWAGPYYKKD